MSVTKTLTSAKGGDENSFSQTVTTLIAAFFLAWLWTKPATAKIAERVKPDIILFVADDLGHNDVGYLHAPGGAS